MDTTADVGPSDFSTSTANPSSTLSPSSYTTETSQVLPSTSTHSSSDPDRTLTNTSIDSTISSTVPSPITSINTPKPAKPKISKSQTTPTLSQPLPHAKASHAKSRLSGAARPSSSGHSCSTSRAIPIPSAEPEQQTVSKDSASDSTTSSSSTSMLPASEAIAAFAPTDAAYSSAITSYARGSEYGRTSRPMASASSGIYGVYSAVSLYGAAPLLPEMDTPPPSDIATAAKAGIAVGTVCLGTALLGLAIFYFRRQRKASDDYNDCKRSSTPSMTCVDGKDATYHENGDYYPTSPSSPHKGDDLRYSTLIDAWGGAPAHLTQAVGNKLLNIKIVEPGQVAQHDPKTLNPGVSLGGQARKVSAFSDSTARASCNSSEETRNTLIFDQARSNLRRLLGMSRASSLSSASDPAFPVSAKAKNFPIDDNMFLKVPTTAVFRDSSAPSQASSTSHYPESVRNTPSMSQV